MPICCRLPSSINRLIILFAFSMVQMARSQFFKPPGGLLEPAKLSTRTPTSSVTAFNTRVFSFATATKGKMYNPVNRWKKSHDLNE